MKKNRLLKIITLFLFAIMPVENSMFAESEPVVHILIQPLGNVKKEYIDEAVEGINSLYFTKITINDPKPLPKSAYYKPRKRYRAEKLLNFLEKNVNTSTLRSKYVIILGLTEVDISTTIIRIMSLKQSRLFYTSLLTSQRN